MSRAIRYVARLLSFGILATTCRGQVGASLIEDSFFYRPVRR